VDAATDLMVLPGMGGHEYVRTSRSGIGAKTVLDASVPFDRLDDFARVAFARASGTDALDARYEGPTALSWLPAEPASGPAAEPHTRAKTQTRAKTRAKAEAKA